MNPFIIRDVRERSKKSEPPRTGGIMEKNDKPLDKIDVYAKLKDSRVAYVIMVVTAMARAEEIIKSLEFGLLKTGSPETREAEIKYWTESLEYWTESIDEAFISLIADVMRIVK